MEEFEIILNKIEELNDRAWNLRFEKTTLAKKYAQEAFDLSEKNNFEKEKFISFLNLNIAKFILSEQDENLLKNLLHTVDFFEQIAPEEAYANALKYTAEYFEKAGNIENAIDYCEKAIEIASKIDSMSALADAFSLYSDIYSRLKDWETALSYQNKALKIRQKLGNEKAVASSLNLLARIYNLAGNYETALHAYNKAYSHRIKHNDIEGLMWTNIGLAATYLNIDDNNSAEKHYNNALEINIKFNDKRVSLYCYLGLGKMLLNSGDVNDAERFLLKALNIAKQINNILSVFDIYLALSETYEKKNLLDKALKYYKLYHKTKESVINADIQNKLKNQMVSFETERSKREAEISHLKNVKLKNALNKLEEKNIQITDSIRYAQKIQFALIHPMNYLKNDLSDYFILFMPRDIVSGDFYWLNKIDNKIFIVAADCTGHGVPGAFMSILGISFLNDIIVGQRVFEADLILNLLRKNVKIALKQDYNDSQDGMDIALCVVDKQKSIIEYAGAYNPLYIVKNKELNVIKADRMPVGKYLIDDKPFTKNIIDCSDESFFYIFSDGYADQFGGKDFDKFKMNRFKELLTGIYNLPALEQKLILKDTFNNWKGNNQQFDDVLIIGFKV